MTSLTSRLGAVDVGGQRDRATRGVEGIVVPDQVGGRQQTRADLTRAGRAAVDDQIAVEGAVLAPVQRKEMQQLSHKWGEHRYSHFVEYRCSNASAYQVQPAASLMEK